MGERAPGLPEAPGGDVGTDGELGRRKAHVLGQLCPRLPRWLPLGRPVMELNPAGLQLPPSLPSLIPKSQGAVLLAPETSPLLVAARRLPSPPSPL